MSRTPPEPLGDPPDGGLAPLPGDLTRLLRRQAAGDLDAGEALLGLVYSDLRELAARHLGRERRDHTLQPTALLHEAWLRLQGRDDLRFPSRSHYLALASRVMRSVLVDHARRRTAEKRGGDRDRITLTDRDAPEGPPALDLLALDEALENLATVDPELTRIVELRFFGGLTAEEAAETLGLPKRTLERRYRTASAWLRRALS